MDGDRALGRLTCGLAVWSLVSGPPTLPSEGGDVLSAWRTLGRGGGGGLGDLGLGESLGENIWVHRPLPNRTTLCANMGRRARRASTACILYGTGMDWQPMETERGGIGMAPDGT